jgi:hypothetical protein
MQIVRIEKGGNIALIRNSRHQAKAMLIPCPDPTIAKSFAKKIEIVFGKYIAKLKLGE